MRQSAPLRRFLLVGALVGASASAGCFPRFVTPPIPAPAPATLAAVARDVAADPDRIGLRVMVDSVRGAVVALAGPYRLPPAATGHMGGHADHARMGDGHHGVVPLRFDWPVEGWLRGYEVAVFDASGAPADPSLIHHFNAINFDRRQFIYPTAEKLVGVGRETGSVDLPISMGVPLAPGHRLGMYAAWHNETGREVEVFVRLILRWTPAYGPERPVEVLPINLDVNNVPGGSSAYDLPPGRSSRAFEFDAPLGGRLLAISGHLHDYGLAVRLEEAATGREVAAVKGRLDPEGRILGVEQKKWLGLFGRGIRLEEGRRYRLVGEYMNREPDTLRAGAMAHMIAVFAPDDWTAWPALDPTHPDYRVDVEGWDLHLTSDEFMRLRARMAPATAGRPQPASPPPDPPGPG